MRLFKGRTQDGQAVVIVAAIIVALIVMGALVFDVGLATTDRRNLQAYSDAAAVAGARSYTSASVAGAHWVAMQYLTGPLGFALPTGSCNNSSTCPAGTYTVGPYTVQLADSTLPGWAYPTALDVVITHQQPSIFSRIMGFANITVSASARGAKPGPQLTGAAYALAAVSGDAQINGGGAAFQTVTGAVYAFGNFGGNNGPHSTGIPSKLTNYDGTTCAGSPANQVSLGGSSDSLNYHTSDNPPNPPATQNVNQPVPTTFDNASPTSAGPTYTTVGAAKDGLGHWKPGIYNGIAPSGGLMNGGVYKIINDTTSLSLGSITNVIHTASGTEDSTGAVAIVLDSSDTAGLDISSAVLNGLDDLHPASYSGGPRDPLGTHNMVIYGGNGAGGYSQSVSVGPGATTDLSGIIYLPKVAYSSHGNSSPQFTGAATFASMTVNGGGNGAQVFHWVCGLNAVAAAGSGGGLIR
jgi:putative Flp pilus-assembly TadE/G-like protein